MPRFDLTHNPVANTKKAVRRKPVGRRTLSADEVAQVWHAGGISLPSHLALKLLIATGQRVEEVLQANWREFDLKEKLWTIPAERRKNRHDMTEPHIVPLWERLAGCFSQPSGVSPALILAFSSRLLRCLGTATIEASMIWPPIAK